MAESIDRKGTVGEMGIRELAGGALLIPSYTGEGVFYKTHPESGYCNCPHHEKQNAFCKHLVLAQAIEKARELRFGSRIAQSNIIELCQRIFAKLDSETCRSSYDLLLEVVAYRYSTDRMVKAALKRHHRVLSLHERSAA